MSNAIGTAISPSQTGYFVAIFLNLPGLSRRITGNHQRQVNNPMNLWTNRICLRLTKRNSAGFGCCWHPFVSGRYQQRILMWAIVSCCVTVVRILLDEIIRSWQLVYWRRWYQGSSPMSFFTEFLKFILILRHSRIGTNPFILTLVTLRKVKTCRIHLSMNETLLLH